jgi:predicted alpha/beta hydrolase
MSQDLRIVSLDGVHHTASLCFADPSPSAPLLVCLPAMGLTAEYYRPLGERLASGGVANVALLDLRGQGRSTARAAEGADFGYREILEYDLPVAVAALRRVFPGSRVFLTGHSLGGQLGLFFAARRPEMLDGLILLAAGTAHYRDWPRRKRASAYALTAAVRLASMALPWYPGRALGFGGDQPRRMMRDWGRVTRRGEYRPEGSDFDYEGAARSLELPLLSVGVQGDPVAPTTARQALLARAPRARVTLAEIDGVTQHRPWKRHFSWAREPAEMVLTIDGWLRAHA